MLEHLRVSIKALMIKRGSWLGWSKPENNLLKFNVNGAAKSTEAAGGGVLRDSNGFSSFYWQESALWAELEAIYEARNICLHMGITN